jgi:HEXXH motif-containing protein
MTTIYHTSTSRLHGAFRGFARAGAPFDEAWLVSLLAQRRARLGSRFLKCFGATLTARGRGLDAIIEREPAFDLESAWPIAVGQIRRAMLTSPRDSHRALVAAIGLGLHDAAGGRRTSFEVWLERAEPFLFGGHWLPEATKITWESHETHAHVRLTCGSSVTELAFERERGTWRGPSSLPCVATKRRHVVVLPSLPFSVPLPEALVAAKASAELRHRCAEAFELVACVSPAHVPWIERVVRALLPVATPGGKSMSSSFEDLPGVIALSEASLTIMIADALVHEASYQHAFFLQQLGPVDDGTDEELYWCPARGEHRPIGMILLAYHAFVNTLAFWEACRERGAGDPELCDRMVDSYARSCRELRRPLETTSALTPIGRALID